MREGMRTRLMGLENPSPMRFGTVPGDSLLYDEEAQSAKVKVLMLISKPMKAESSTKTAVLPVGLETGSTRVLCSEFSGKRLQLGGRNF